ncbi:DUF1800 domain-containing protein [Nocardioides sp. TRM66260-LWL]|uniref:DUF1800 domain-containing protein n=1 Tax=Nocardioides sp. TRM66260-LWL TaxID=2874478 RepID=UPI001CC6A290|nr:DUF1800 domain-containing protein [Nocardioides sp. TRM66260-LWL]MBZ5733947.1 DUF1800 domain-containing protein [Nocardioides sp. TRM66260-LWL]
MAPPTVLPAADRHLLERFSYGITPSLADEVRSAGSARAWFDRQLRGEVAEDGLVAAIPTWFPGLNNPPPTAALLAGGGARSAYQSDTEVIARTLARRLLSKRQVYERMVDWASNLLYVPAVSGRPFPWRSDFDENVIRPRALGSYRALLQAATVHPAMVVYLNGDQNARGAVNENHARELLELHTVGRRAYRESDVKQLTRLLTGFTIDDRTTLYTCGYDPARHQTGTVRILGFTHRNADRDGRAAVRAFLDYAALHPATARRVATRLCQRFVADEPDPALVRHVAAAYLAARSDLPSTLRALVRHPAFAASAGGLTRLPGDDVVRSARALGLRPLGAGTGSLVHRLVSYAEDMGQVSYRWPAPDGWPERSRTYLGPARMLRGWQAHYELTTVSSASGQAAVAPEPFTQLPDRWPVTLRALVEQQTVLLLGRHASARLVDAVADVLGLRPGHLFTGPGQVDQRVYRLVRGTVLNDPSGVRR